MESTKTALTAVDEALGAEFVRLAQLYGAYAVATVAMGYIASAIVTARKKCRPAEDSWISDLTRSFKEALTREV